MIATAMGLVREGEQEAGEAMPDRRESAFRDPRFWVAVTSVLLTLCLFVFSFIASMLFSINGKLESGALTDMQQTERITELQKQVTEAKAELKSLQADKDNRNQREADYRFAIGKLLTEINTTLKLKGEIP